MKEGTREVGEYRPSCLTMLVVLVLLVVLARYHPGCSRVVPPCERDPSLCLPEN